MSTTPAPRASASSSSPSSTAISRTACSARSTARSSITDAVDATGWTKLDEVPFDYQRRRVSLLLESEGRTPASSSRAAPRTCSPSPRATRPRKATPAARSRRRWHGISTSFSELSGEGFRLLAVAFRPVESGKARGRRGRRDALVFVGYVALLRSAEGERRRNGARPCRARRRPEDPDRRRRAGDAPCLRRARHPGHRRARRQGARRAFPSRRSSRGSNAPTSSSAWSRRTSGAWSRR